MRKKYKLTEKEMVEFFDYMKNAAGVAVFDTLHHIEERGDGKETVEELEKEFREELDSVKKSASKKVIDAVEEIATVAIFLSLLRKTKGIEKSE